MPRRRRASTRSTCGCALRAATSRSLPDRVPRPRSAHCRGRGCGLVASKKSRRCRTTARESKTLDALDPNVPFCESHMQSTSTEEEETLVLSSDCETCKKFTEQYKVESVKAANDPTRIVMEFETDGSLSAKAVLLASLDILSKRFSELATQASALA